MINRTLSFPALFFFALSFLACSEDNPVPGEVSGQMSASIDDVSWKSIDVTAAYQEVEGGYTTISAQASDGSIIRLGLEGKESGTYDTDPATRWQYKVYGSKVIYLPPVSDSGFDWYSSYKANLESDEGGTVTIKRTGPSGNNISGKFEVLVSRPKLEEDGTLGSPIEFEKVTLKGTFNDIPLQQIEENQAAAVINKDPSDFSRMLGTADWKELIIELGDEQYNLAISLPAHIQAGTYQFVQGMQHRFFRAIIVDKNYSIPIRGDYYTNGTIIITKHDRLRNRIEGYYLFDFARTPEEPIISIVDGSFSLTYRAL